MSASHLAEEDGEPTGDSESEAPRTPGRTVAAVARRLGIAPATLRTWDRRYGLGPSEHTAGAHRRYTETDVERLATMRRLTLDGVTPADAARHVLAQTATERRPDPVAESSNHGGGSVLSLPGSDPTVRGLARAAMALDDRACIQAVRDCLTSHGVVYTWDELVSPVLIAIGERWAATGLGVDVEHLLSESVLVALRTAPAPAEPLNSVPVLLSGAEDEQHALPLHVLRVGLAERGIAARVLGGRVPRAALAAAVRRTGPPAVFIWSQLHPTGDPEQLRAVPMTRPSAALVLGGPGWDSYELPPSAHRVTTLNEALDLLQSLAHPE